MDARERRAPRKSRDLWIAAAVDRAMMRAGRASRGSAAVPTVKEVYHGFFEHHPQGSRQGRGTRRSRRRRPERRGHRRRRRGRHRVRRGVRRRGPGHGRCRHERRHRRLRAGRQGPAVREGPGGRGALQHQVRRPGHPLDRRRRQLLHLPQAAHGQVHQLRRRGPARLLRRCRRELGLDAQHPGRRPRPHVPHRHPRLVNPVPLRRARLVLGHRPHRLCHGVGRVPRVRRPRACHRPVLQRL